MKAKILIAALDWGLGHSTRVVPIVHKLHQKNKQIHLAGTKEQIAFWKSESLPVADYHEIVSYNIRLSADNGFFGNYIIQSPTFFQRIIKEKKQVTSLQKKHGFEQIISDHRYGFRIKNVKSIFICHQLNIKVPIFQSWANYIHRYLMEKFDEIWCPDYEEMDKKLAGELSIKPPNLKKPLRYLGPLSRFAETSIKASYTAKPNQVLVILSGPEPMKSKLKQQVIAMAQSLTNKIFVLINAGVSAEETDKNCILMPALPKKELLPILLESSEIVSRSGYSSIMDLYFLKSNAWLLASPHQYEQIYLAKHLNGKYGFKCFEKWEDLEKSFIELG